MERNAISSLILFLFFTLCSCEIEFNERPRNFSIEILYHTQKQTGGHVVMSPFGIWTLLSGLALGAKGRSYDQLSSALILPKKRDTLIQGYRELTETALRPKSPQVSLTSKNFLFFDTSIAVKPDFAAAFRNLFKGSIKPLNFKAPDATDLANNFIKSVADIKNVFKPGDFDNSKMILANVISFKGLWTSPFNVTDTVVEPFYNENKEVIGQVNMMYQNGKFAYSTLYDLEAFVGELPYGKYGEYSMLIFLPFPKVKVDDMYKNFKNVTLRDVLNKLQDDVDKFGLAEMDFKIPRFKISTNIVLNKPLNDMGVYDIFESSEADFGDITSTEVFVSSIVHKADIEVTEAGTVASAVTEAEFIDKIATPNIHANKPFAYFIVEKSTASVIFSGIYSKPTMF